jgi:hypothetical protein
MTTSPDSPRLIKGAIVGIDLFNPLSSVVIFQYNPHTIQRTLKPRTLASSSPNEGGPCTGAQQVNGAPVETITMEVTIDATDPLEVGDELAQAAGVYPQLSALEMLLYPRSAQVITNTILHAVGTVEVLSPLAPMTLLIWGYKRVVPVSLTSLAITEEEFDPDLNPVRARAEVSLRVLSYNDLSATHPGYYLFLANQVVKEGLGTLASARGLAAVGAVLRQKLHI